MSHRGVISLMTFFLLVFGFAPATFYYRISSPTPDAPINSGMLSSSSPAALTDGSWNPAVSCTAVITTVEHVLGSQYNTTTGGALYSGGGFRPGIPSKRALNPPCTAGTPANATFVEFHNVTMAGSTMTVEDCSTNYAQVNGGGSYPNGQNCDLTRNLFDPAGPRTPNVLCPRCMSGLFVEIDRDWNASGTAPPMIGVNGTKEKIDVQGFLYWNPNELDQDWHLYSGWELHPLTAWRLSGESTPDYYLANKRLMTVPTGSSNSVTVYVGSINGFQGNISLTTSISNSGPLISLSTADVRLNATGSGNSARVLLTVSAQGTSPGGYLVTLTGTSGLTVHESRVTVIVTNPYFTISVTPDSLAVQRGDVANFLITMTSVNGFEGTLALSAVSPTGITSTVNPSSVTLSTGGQVNSTLTLTIALDADSGIHSVAVSGTDGTQSHSTDVLVQVLTPPPTEGFDISANPGSLSLVRGQTGSANITVTSINGFAGNISFTEAVSPVAGLSCSLTPLNVTLVSLANTHLSCNGVAGAYNVLVVANSGNISRTVNLALTVVEPPSLSATPGTLVIDAGITGSSIITVNDFASTLSLGLSWTPRTGLSCSLDTDSLTSQDDASLLSCKGAAGAYVVTVTGTSGTHTASTTVTYVLEDFSLAALPAKVTVITGNVGSATVTMTSLNGFNRTVKLGLAVSPAQGLNCSLTQTSFNLETSATSELRCSGSPGIYSVTITASTDPLSHTLDVSMAMSDFSLYAPRLALIVEQGKAESATITVNGLYGFQGQVSLSTQSSIFGLDVSVSPQNVILSGQEISAILTVAAASSLTPGNYSFVVSAADEPATHSLSVAVTVQSSRGVGTSTADFTVLGLSLMVITAVAASLLALFRRRRKQSRHGE